MRVAAAVLLLAATAAAPARFGSWGIVCGTEPGSACVASQLVAADPAGRQILLGVTLTPARRGEPPLLHLRVAPGIDRRAGFGIKLDNGAELRLPVDACSFRACETSGRLNPAIRARFAAAKMAQVAWRLNNGKQMLVPVNLRQFEQALAAIATPKRAGPRSVRT